MLEEKEQISFIESAGIIIYKNNGVARTYLLLHYYPGNHWDFPKGRVEHGETQQQAALRELAEETGLTAKLSDQFQEKISYDCSYENEMFLKTVYFFLGKADKSVVHLSDEHQGYIWLPYTQALQQLTYENAKKVLQKAERYLSTHKE